MCRGHPGSLAKGRALQEWHRVPLTSAGNRSTYVLLPHRPITLAEGTGKTRPWEAKSNCSLELQKPFVWEDLRVTCYL